MWLKTNCVLVVSVFLSLMSVTSASAASREIEDFCFEQLQKATLPLRPRGAGEAFMANCIANRRQPKRASTALIEEPRSPAVC